MDIHIDAGQVTAYASRMAGAERIVTDELSKGVKTLALHGERFAKQNLTSNGSVVTGTLRRSVTTQASGLTARYGTAVPYGKYVEFGRGPVVARGRALRFRPKGGGGYIFRKRVGPAAPRPFMKPTVAQVRAIAPRELSAVVGRIAARLGG